jgi:hypothetical protein
VLRAVRAELASSAFAYLRRVGPDPRGEGLVAVAGALGPRYVMAHADRQPRVLETLPSRNASRDAPFDRAEAIGWHNDFSTRALRPRLTLAYADRADPHGPPHGSWRVALCDRVLATLEASTDGRAAVRFLREAVLPYSFAVDSPPAFFRAIECRGEAPGRRGLRFYGRAMRDGARVAYGHVPEQLEVAVQAVEDAADRVGTVLPAQAGDLLVTDNWHCLHDRLAQTVDPALPLRRSLLCFVGEVDSPSPN